MGIKINNFAAGAVLAALSVVAGVSSASATTFVASGPSASVSQTGDVATLTYNTTGFGPDTWTMTAIAPVTEALTVTYESTGFYAWFDVQASMNAFSGGASQTVYAYGPASCCNGPPSGGFDYTGSVTLNLVKGQNYGFSVTGSNADSNDVLSGALTVTGVTAGVPEVSTWAMMLAGFASLGFVGYRRHMMVPARVVA